MTGLDAGPHLRTSAPEPETGVDGFIAGVGKALPPHYYDQETLVAAFRERWGAAHHNVDRLERLHRAVLVGGRHLALPIEEYPDLTPWGKANDAWIRVAQEVGAEAIADALSVSGVPIERVGAFFTTTVTGVATPSLDARLVDRLGFESSVKRTPIFGLGCLGGAAGVARAADYVKAYPAEAAILLSVELCSLTIQQEDISVANMISTGLFGDGASCAVLVGAQLAEELGATDGAMAGRWPRVLDSRAVFYPDTQHVMGWDISEKGFKVVLSADVPRLARERLAGDIETFLAEHGLRRDEIVRWVCHPGGPKVLEALQQALELPEDAFALTWKGLEELGNLSSSSVLLVLRETMIDRCPPDGGPGVMVAMGPGFCSETLLLEW